MNAGAALQSAIYLISSSMMIPAMAILVAGFVAVVVSCGAFIGEWSARARGKHGKHAEKSSADGSGAALGHEGYLDTEMSNALAKLGQILQTPGTTWGDVENLWRVTRQGCWKKLDYLRILARLAPAMGLVGTLIPMSTGLASLSQGDTSRLSSDLVIAFSTTVVGLCSGVAAYVLYTVRARWLEGDLDTLNLLMESLAEAALDEREEGEK
ncbi:MAG: MotA/TolQ/ExbB proton channel family protein [Synergistaceae bacterium]|jgi:biopolymer transport protein ExbB/TolQ|nr:MotA/TolQ/ExbB proton channel family protein [Synergistaceae bacterium]